MKATQSLLKLLVLSGLILAIVGAVSILATSYGGGLMKPSTNADAVAFQDEIRYGGHGSMEGIDSVSHTAAILAGMRPERQMVMLREQENSEPERDYESDFDQVIRISHDISLFAVRAFGWG